MGAIKTVASDDSGRREQLPHDRGMFCPFPQLFTSAPTTNISLFFSNLCRKIHFHLFTISTFSSTATTSPRPTNTRATMSSKPQQELAVPSRLPDPVLIIVMVRFLFVLLCFTQGLKFCHRALHHGRPFKGISLCFY